MHNGSALDCGSNGEGSIPSSHLRHIQQNKIFLQVLNVVGSIPIVCISNVAQLVERKKRKGVLMRSREYRRFQRENHIKRKEDFLKRSRTDNPPHKYNDSEMWDNIEMTTINEGYCSPHWYVNHRGKLDKGKIHCSCAMCSAKTRNKGSRIKLYGNYSPSLNYKISDLKKIEKMDYED